MKYILLLLSVIIFSCSNPSDSSTNQENSPEEKVDKTTADQKPSAAVEKPMHHMSSNDERISLGLNPMQKQHQLEIMRQHLVTIQKVLEMMSNDEYEKAAETIDIELGSTTEMKLMCASFGNETFEKIGIEMHKSADNLSRILRTKDKDKALNELSNTMNYCTSCHTAFKQ